MKRKKTGSHATPVESDPGAMAIMKDYIRVTMQVLVVPHLACDLLLGVSTIIATKADLQFRFLPPRLSFLANLGENEGWRSSLSKDSIETLGTRDVF